ncbi:MAG: 1-(5-phosphoribosyl)-5-[(5-phosphoribosylamino)methylideneamino]imidazole-4-carboxamide isomerase [Lachnospiraceae bacterium]|nr:1-(5-phosphoribosyl)-5-[(5-phosphoribosylamino)methylideneamino]imidazole-4-carboxamide isomerase [Lachnospiraceae bacterium]
MKLYPAIDIKNGQCVRLCQGVFSDVNVYAKKPYTVAKEFEAAGASFLHIVDLDGALAGHTANAAAISDIVKNISIPAEIGGGIRTIEDIEQKLKLGLNRVIIGTKAVKEPQFVKEAIGRFGAERIVIGIDAKDGMAAIEGWETVSDKNAVAFALEMKNLGASTVIYTDISRDGMLSGPNFARTEEMIRETGMEIIASGGVSSMEDLVRLEAIGAAGAIIGKAIYEKKVNLAEAVARFER